MERGTWCDPTIHSSECGNTLKAVLVTLQNSAHGLMSEKARCGKKKTIPRNYNLKTNFSFLYYHPIFYQTMLFRQQPVCTFLHGHVNNFHKSFQIENLKECAFIFQRMCFRITDSKACVLKSDFVLGVGGGRQSSKFLKILMVSPFPQWSRLSFEADEGAYLCVGSVWGRVWGLIQEVVQGSDSRCGTGADVTDSTTLEAVATAATSVETDEVTYEVVST